MSRLPNELPLELQVKPPFYDGLKKMGGKVTNFFFTIKWVSLGLFWLLITDSREDWWVKWE